MPTPTAIFRKIQTHLRLLRDNPETFAANLLQFTHPTLFREKLADVLAAAPLHVRIDPGLAARPALNVLQPVLSPESMTGGPNTIVNLAFWLAMQGTGVRLVTTRPAPRGDPDWFWRHLAAVTGDTSRPSTLTVVSAADPANLLPIGPRDMFLATHWTTAQQVKTWLPAMNVKRFFYLIQDFEPGFYAWSSNHALALETYGLDHIGIFNERLLFDYFLEQKPGRYADPGFDGGGLVFEPAIDRALFHPTAEPRRPAKQRLLFYTRPTNPRNMLGLGLAALRRATSAAAFQGQEWEFLAIGGRGSVPVMPIRPGVQLTPAPWADYAGYAALLRDSDILLCPMLSPHTSYPVLEMAASGGIAVTNVFATKTRDRLAAISANIVAVPATEDGFIDGLIEAASRVTHGVDPAVPLNLPMVWRDSIAGIAERMTAMFRDLTQPN